MNDYVLKATKVHAPEINMQDFLKKDEIDATDIPRNEINKSFNKQKLRDFMKDSKSFMYTRSPVMPYKTGLTKKSILEYEASSKTFKTFDELKKYIDENDGLIVHQTIHNTPFDKYMLRFFNIKTTFLKYWYNRLTTWKNKI